MKNQICIIAAIVALSMIQMSSADSGTYELDIDGKTFDVTYGLDGEVIAMQVDQESTSLLVGTTNVEDSTFEIGFSSELLSATNGEFIVLVDGLETDYTISYNDGKPTITFPIEAGSEEIEIIGTSVIPEFPFGAIAVMGAVSAMVLVFSRAKTLLR
ncbi:MAG: hypothetical protein WAO91_07445 [Candidatus Nitrosotenuis sp.]